MCGVPHDKVAWADVAATQDKLLFNNIINNNHVRVHH
jgi:hypothetical protein